MMVRTAARATNPGGLATQQQTTIRSRCLPRPPIQIIYRVIQKLDKIFAAGETSWS